MKKVVLAMSLLLAAYGSPAREVQSHGLLFEKWLRDTFFGGYEPKGYTQKWDIPAEANPDHGRIPVNPKAAKYGSPIGLGDAVRQFEINEPFLLIAGFWEQITPEEKRWVNVQAVRVEPKVWRSLWGDLARADLDRLIAVIKDKSLTLAQARERVQKLKAAAPYSTSVIELNPKIDRSQRRLQCSLSFDDFFKHLATKSDRSAQDHPVIFGQSVPRQFASAPRVITPEK